MRFPITASFSKNNLQQATFSIRPILTALFLMSKELHSEKMKD